MSGSGGGDDTYEGAEDGTEVGGWIECADMLGDTTAFALATEGSGDIDMLAVDAEG
jgi:hypothetical protein